MDGAEDEGTEDEEAEGEEEEEEELGLNQVHGQTGLLTMMRNEDDPVLAFPSASQESIDEGLLERAWGNG